MKRTELVLTAIMATCAVVVAGALIRREILGPSNLIGGPPATVVTAIDSTTWSALLALGRPITIAPKAHVRVVVFSDYECPACRGFHKLVRELESEVPGALDVRLVHLPLSYHRFAQASARVSECAAEQGAFSGISDALLEAQDSLGIVSWADLAIRAGARDPVAVAECASDVRDSLRFSRIASGTMIAASVGAPGTPTVVIEGKLYSRVPNRAELLRVSRVGR